MTLERGLACVLLGGVGTLTRGSRTTVRLVILTGDGLEHRFVANALSRTFPGELQAILIVQPARRSLLQQIRILLRRYTGRQLVSRLGVRAYAAQPGLAAANGQLLKYAKNGGVVIVQYNLGQFDYGPYPYSLGNAEKVVDEKAPVQLLMPESAVLSWPNKITPRDFDGWVEERGHGFMESWDPRYQALLEMHDPEQDPQKGGLLVAKTGKGAYVYVALALYRELPEGVPGAYRLFANLLSLGKSSAAQK